MSKRIIIVASAFAAIAAFGLGVHAETAGKLKFAVENDTGSVLSGVQIASASGGGWNDVSLEQAGLKTGESTAGHASRIGGECLYNIRAEFQGRASIEQDGVDLCDLDADTLVLRD
jgi:hypothetical protein